MVLLPEARLLPFTERLVAPNDKVPLPSVVLPSENVTLPVGVVVPLAAFTVAVITVDEVDAMLVGLARLL